MSWAFLAVLAAFLWAITNVIDKFVVSKLVRSPLLPSIVMGTGALVAGVLVIVIHGTQLMAPLYIGLALLAGILYFVACLSYFYALQGAEVSRVIPLFYVEPLIIAALSAIFLGEIFGPITYLGVILLVAGAMLITAERSFKPRLNRSFWLMMFAAVALSIMHVITKYLLSFADVWTIYAYVRLGTFIPTLPLLIMNIKDFKVLYRERGFLPYLCMISSETLNYTAYLAFTFATAIGFVTLANAFSSAQPFFTLLFAVLLSLFFPHVVKEEIDRHTVGLKIAAIVTMFAGVLLIG